MSKICPNCFKTVKPQSTLVLFGGRGYFKITICPECCYCIRRVKVNVKNYKEAKTQMELDL